MCICIPQKTLMGHSGRNPCQFHLCEFSAFSSLEWGLESRSFNQIDNLKSLAEEPLSRWFGGLWNSSVGEHPQSGHCPSTETYVWDKASRRQNRTQFSISLTSVLAVVGKQRENSNLFVSNLLWRSRWRPYLCPHHPSLTSSSLICAFLQEDRQRQFLILCACFSPCIG